MCKLVIMWMGSKLQNCDHQYNSAKTGHQLIKDQLALLMEFHNYFRYSCRFVVIRILQLHNSRY